MELAVTKGTTGLIVLIPIVDTSGDPLTGLLYNTANLVADYMRNTAATKVSISLVNVTTMGTFVSGGFKETGIGGTYALHVPNAALANGADQVVISLSGAAAMADFALSIQLAGQGPTSASGSSSSALTAGEVIQGAKELLALNPDDPEFTDEVMLRDLGRIQADILTVRPDLLLATDGTRVAITWPTTVADTLIMGREWEHNLVVLLAAHELFKDSGDTGNAKLAAAWRTLGEKGLIG